MQLMQIFRRNKNPKTQKHPVITHQSEEQPADTPRLTSARLAEFNANPLLFRQQELGLAPESSQRTDEVVLAARTLILQGREAFERAYAIGGPIDKSSGEPYPSYSFEFRRWAEAQGKPALQTEDAAIVEKIAASVLAHSHAASLLEQGEPEQTVRGCYAGADCETRIDWLHPERGIVALNISYSIDHLAYKARNMGGELAFARAVLAAATGDEVDVHVIGVESAAPFRCGVCTFKTQALEKVQKQNAKDIARLLECRRTDTWLTGYEEIIPIDYIN